MHCELAEEIIFHMEHYGEGWELIIKSCESDDVVKIDITRSEMIALRDVLIKTIEGGE